MKVPYKNYILEPDSHQSPETKKWSATIMISKMETSGTYNSLPFTVKNTFNSQEEADNISLQLGKEIIDGKSQEKVPF